MATFFVTLWPKICFTASVSVVTFVLNAPPLTEKPPESAGLIV